MFRREKNRALHMRLTEWGEWRNQPITGLGYKSKTIEHTMMEMGGIYSDGGFRSITPNYKPNRKCAEVDSIVNQLKDKPKQAVFCRYAVIIKDHEIYTALGCGKRQYQRYLNQAYKDLCDSLGIEFEKGHRSLA